MRDLCFIDIETTGSIFGFHEIIELAAMRTSPDGTELLGIWERRFRPFHPERITAIAQRINNFPEDNWEEAEMPDLRLWSSLTAFWHDCTPVCHNPSFERAFITLSAFQAGIEDIGLDYHWIGTESLGWPLFRYGDLKELSLSNLLAYLGLGPEQLPHRAMAGANACREVYLKLMDIYIRPEVWDRSAVKDHSTT